MNGFVGSVYETALLRSYLLDKNINDKPIKEVMGAAYPVVKKGASIDAVSKLITKENQVASNNLDTIVINYILKNGDVNFSKSNQETFLF